MAVGDNIKRLRKARKMTQHQLVAAVRRRGGDLSQPQLSAIERGEVERPGALIEIAEEFGVFPNWLLTGEGMKDHLHPAAPFAGPDPVLVEAGRVPGGFREDLPPFNALPAPNAPQPPGRHEMTKDVPVMGTGQGGGAEADFEMNGQIVDFVRRPPRLVGRRDIFAIYLQGDSVSPWREPGQLIYAEGLKSPRNMDYVIIELKPTSSDDVRPALVKRLIAVTPTKVRLEQYKPAKVFEIDRKRILRIHRVMDWDELLGV